MTHLPLYSQTRTPTSYLQTFTGDTHQTIMLRHGVIICYCSNTHGLSEYVVKQQYTDKKCNHVVTIS